MHQFCGDLLIGGSALRQLHGTLEEGSDVSGADGASRDWSGRFEIEPDQQEALQIGRQYLLMLDDGRNAEVVVTEVHAEPDHNGLVCEFESWRNRVPK